MHHIGQCAHEEPHDRIEADEQESRQQAKFGISEFKIGDDEVCEARQQLAVDKVHHIQDRQKAEKDVVTSFDIIIVVSHTCRLPDDPGSINFYQLEPIGCLMYFPEKLIQTFRSVAPSPSARRYRDDSDLLTVVYKQVFIPELSKLAYGKYLNAGGGSARL